MSPVAAIVILLALAAVILFVAAPLRGHDADAAGASSADADPSAAGSSPQAELAREAVIAREQLEAAREAKYREIRDARLDFRLGKVSAADHAATEGELRAQALAIVRELETLA